MTEFRLRWVCLLVSVVWACGCDGQIAADTAETLVPDTRDCQDIRFAIEQNLFTLYKASIPRRMLKQVLPGLAEPLLPARCIDAGSLTKWPKEELLPPSLPSLTLHDAFLDPAGPASQIGEGPTTAMGAFSDTPALLDVLTSDPIATGATPIVEDTTTTRAKRQVKDPGDHPPPGMSFNPFKDPGDRMKAAVKSGELGGMFGLLFGDGTAATGEGAPAEARDPTLTSMMAMSRMMGLGQRRAAYAARAQAQAAQAAQARDPFYKRRNRDGFYGDTVGRKKRSAAATEEADAADTPVVLLRQKRARDGEEEKKKGGIGGRGGFDSFFPSLLSPTKTVYKLGGSYGTDAGSHRSSSNTIWPSQSRPPSSGEGEPQHGAAPSSKASPTTQAPQALQAKPLEAPPLPTPPPAPAPPSQQALPPGPAASASAVPVSSQPHHGQNCGDSHSVFPAGSSPGGDTGRGRVKRASSSSSDVITFGDFTMPTDTFHKLINPRKSRTDDTPDYFPQYYPQAPPNYYAPPPPPPPYYMAPPPPRLYSAPHLPPQGPPFLTAGRSRAASLLPVPLSQRRQALVPRQPVAGGRYLSSAAASRRRQRVVYQQQVALLAARERQYLARKRAYLQRLMAANPAAAAAPVALPPAAAQPFVAPVPAPAVAVAPAPVQPQAAPLPMGAAVPVVYGNQPRATAY